ncbi:hypothetical protein [Algoriphagus algorifonticola]|uniref:hypothetical protein n=1 Tax=Algoriphagus algorifonticola TaxID=2593007 RepID=UPI0011A8DB7F|nr:hypothetical protein [Algoriphagus algorifonticola]
MKPPNTLFSYISWLSIDVVLGAMAGMLFFSKLLHVPLAWDIYALLGLCVWVIYTADHLLDSRKKVQIDLSPRHQFHARHQKILLLSLALATLLGLSGAIWILGWSRELFWSLFLAGAIAGSMALIRLGGNAGKGLKELSTAVFYVLGIAWIPLLRADALDRDWRVGVFLLVFTLLAFLNLLMLSWMDRRKDELAGFPSAAQLIQPGQLLDWIRRLALLLIIISLTLFIALPSFFRMYSCILLIMVILHFLIFFNKNLSEDQIRSRMEAVFLLPWIVLIF